MKRLLAALLLLAPAPALAQPMTLALTAGNMLAQTHSHALFLTITGTYGQLTGTLNYDLAAQTCHIDVTFTVESLQLPNAMVRSQTMSADMLDPQDYPTQHFVGDCKGNQLTGELTMRGQTHPTTATITYETTNGVVTALHTDGLINRLDWGMTGSQMTVSKIIRVTNDISLNGQPPVAAAQ